MMRFLSIAAMATMFFVAGSAKANSINFSELPFQTANGLNFNGVTFGFTSSDVNFGSGGPGVTPTITDPSLEGNAAGILTLTFDAAVSHVDFDVALSTFGTLTPGYTVSLFAPGGALISASPVSTSVPAGFTFTEGSFSYTGSAVASISIDFDDLAGRFVLDNLNFDFAAAGPGGPAGVPLPAAVWGGMAMASALGLKKRLRR